MRRLSVSGVASAATKRLHGAAPLVSLEQAREDRTRKAAFDRARSLGWRCDGSRCPRGW
jgi:hypothetical protein